MTDATLRAFQRHMRELYGAKDEARGVEASMLWLVEEIGELAETVRKRDLAAAREELADVVAWTASVANVLGIELADAVAEKYPAGACRRCGQTPCGCPEA